MTVRMRIMLAAFANFKRWVPAIAFSLLWVYGVFGCLLIVSSCFHIDFLANLVIARLTLFGISVPMIVLNNMMTFMIGLRSRFNPIMPISGIAGGLLLGARDINGVAAMKAFAWLITQPFAFFELGAYVLASCVSFYEWQYEEKFSSRKMLIVVIIGIAMLIVAAFMELM